MIVLMTRREAASYLGVQPATLAQWAWHKRYKLTYFKIGGAVRYRKDDLDRFLSTHVIHPWGQ